MRGFAALHLRRVREHLGRTLLSLVGVGVGSMLVVSMLGLFGSLTSSVEQVADLAGDADLEVSGSTDAGFDAALVERITSLPEVASAVPLVRTPVVIGSERVLLVGVDRPTPGVECEGARPDAGLFVGKGLGLGRGDVATVYSRGTTTRVPVADVLACPQVDALSNGRFAAAVLPVAQQLTGRPGRLDSVLVEARPGVPTPDLRRQVEAAVDGQAVVAPPGLRVEQARDALTAFQQGLLLAVALTFVVAGFLVFNTMSMAALERRRELATMRAVGGTRRRLMAGFLAEAALLGLVGSLLGALAGIGLGRAFLAAVPAIVLDVVGVQPTFSLVPAAVPAAVALGTLATLVASFFPARAAMRVAPVEAMRPEGVLEGADSSSSVNIPALVVGTIVFVASTVTAVGAEGNLTMAGFAGQTLGVVLASYGLMGPLARVTARVATVFGGAGRLAAASIERSPRRTWATTVAVIVGVASVVSIGGVVRNQTRTLTESFSSLADTDLWIETSPGDTLPTDILMPESWGPELDAIPGVASVLPGQLLYATIGQDQVLVEALDPESNAPPLARGGAAGRAALRTPEGAVVTIQFARRFGVGEGDTVELPTPSGLQRVRIGAVSQVATVTPAGAMAVPYDSFVTWFGRRGASVFEIAYADGADGGAVTRRVRDFVAQAPYPLFVESGAKNLEEASSAVKQSSQVFSSMAYAVVVATALAMFNTLMISVVERRRELGIIRALGTSRTRLRRMVLAEAAAIALVGVVMGVVLGLAQHRVGNEAVTGLTGVKLDYQFVFTPLLLAAVAALAMTGLGSLMPAWRAARVNVIEAIGYE